MFDVILFHSFQIGSSYMRSTKRMAQYHFSGNEEVKFNRYNSCKCKNIMTKSNGNILLLKWLNVEGSTLHSNVFYLAVRIFDDILMNI